MTDPQDYRRRLEADFDLPHDAPPDLRFATAPGELGRRDFVRLLGASLALAGLSGCVRRPREPILPYVTRPSGATPTAARHYATSMTLDGYATGLLVESHTGRPTKIEGNPDHPASLGAAGVFEQASLLGLYDPQRARTVRLAGRRSGWPALTAALDAGAIRKAAGARGAGLHILLEPTASPLVHELLAGVRARYPDARVHWDAPLAGEAHAGTTSAFGRPAQPVYDFTAADVVVSLDADMLGPMPFGLRYAHDFAASRRIASPSDRMSRLYVIETAPSVTGGSADHRLAVRPSEIPALAAALAVRLAPATGLDVTPSAAPAYHAGWLDAVAGDLLAHRGASALVAGERQPAAVHAIVHLLNLALGNVGHTVRYIEPPIPPAEPDTGLDALAEVARGGGVGWLVILDGNPVYTAAAALNFATLLERLPNSVYLGLYRNETARACRWFVPGRHYLESWGDGRAWDGTLSPVQPLVDPLFGGHAALELLAVLAGDTRGPHDLVRDAWRKRSGVRGPSWEEALQRGVLDGSASPSLAVKAAGPLPAVLADIPTTPTRGTSLELTLVPGGTVHDGRFANNPWLQELPDPVTKLTWGNAALLSPATAARLKIESGRMLAIVSGARSVAAPALIVPGHADEALTLALGYGRAVAGRGEGVERVAAGVGANAYALRDGHHRWSSADIAVRPLAQTTKLAVTQEHWTMDGRPIALHASLDAYRRQPEVAPAERGRPLSLYEPQTQPGLPQWAMVIDLSACTGCSACVVACQAENNVPVVGRQGVLDRREMHWLRLDRYSAGTPEEPVVLSQPMLCQHCEKAPCEYVCPVAATVHSPDGLNEMVYNRCVGTRFCSNNCPYKVRRFNWFNYNAEVSETERLAKNPDVTVRARGVMEKCTFCVQRIREAEIAAELEGRPIERGAVRTACQQACPTQAITFGSLTDPGDEVARLRDHPRAYEVLHELGTEPRVRYLARITNPNPRLAPERG
ncbi:MAG: 4Fe-4S dicluster domain-containing protein [Gemmatimonadales bacterium]